MATGAPSIRHTAGYPSLFGKTHVQHAAQIYDQKVDNSGIASECSFFDAFANQCVQNSNLT